MRARRRRSSADRRAHQEELPAQPVPLTPFTVQVRLTLPTGRATVNVSLLAAGLIVITQLVAVAFVTLAT
jgi:hypothetical protein